MKGQSTEDTGAWVIRNVSADLMRRIRMAALAQNTTVRELLIRLAKGHVAEMEKKGLLPKTKG